MTSQTSLKIEDGFRDFFRLDAALLRLAELHWTSCDVSPGNTPVLDNLAAELSAGLTQRGVHLREILNQASQADCAEERLRPLLLKLRENSSELHRLFSGSRARVLVQSKKAEQELRQIQSMLQSFAVDEAWQASSTHLIDRLL